MLTKAILTGGVLSAFAGCIVYFGTEGADAQVVDTTTELRLDDSELAGAPNTTIVQIEAVESAAQVETVDSDAQIQVVEAQDPPRETSKPVVKWLDQYLKKSKAKVLGEPMTVTHPEIVTGNETPDVMTEGVNVEIELFDQDQQVVESPMSDEKDGKVSKRLRIEKRIEHDGSQGHAEGRFVVKENHSTGSIDLEGLDLDALNLDGDIDVDVLKKQLGLDEKENVQIRVVKKMQDTPSKAKARQKKRPTIDYDLVLAEARKLLVVDMRNQAVLEIIDYAVDNGDMAQAADLVEDLSTPALRDTARGRIGTGLARQGKAEASFAVLDALEIDELSAPIRLEIITALMATQQERKALKAQ